eukprot:213774_1
MCMIHLIFRSCVSCLSHLHSCSYLCYPSNVWMSLVGNVVWHPYYTMSHNDHHCFSPLIEFNEKSSCLFGVRFKTHCLIPNPAYRSLSSHKSHAPSMIGRRISVASLLNNAISHFQFV